MGSDPSAGKNCTCGNPGALACDECRDPVCRLCVREREDGADVCLACRAAALERAEEKPARAAGSGRHDRLKRLRRRYVLLPGVVVLALAAMSAIAIPVLADAGAAHSERRAESALRAIAEAQQAVARDGARPFLSLEELQQRRLVGVVEAPGYEVKVELARDRKKFWARAVPTRPGLRGIYVDSRGVVGYEGG